MKRGDRVKVPGSVLTVQDGIATVEFNGTYPGNGQRIRIAVEAIDPEDVVDTEAAVRELATRPVRMGLPDWVVKGGHGQGGGRAGGTDEQA